MMNETGIIEIIIEERGNTPLIGERVLVGDHLYEIVEHRGLAGDRGAAINPGSGAANHWRFGAKKIGDIDDLDEGEDQYMACGYIDSDE